MRTKELTNIRAASKDENVKLTPPRLVCTLLHFISFFFLVFAFFFRFYFAFLLLYGMGLTPMDEGNSIDQIVQQLVILCDGAIFGKLYLTHGAGMTDLLKPSLLSHFHLVYLSSIWWI